MANSNRSAFTDLAEAPSAIKPRRYNFFQLVELINSLEGSDQEQALDNLPQNELIRFKSSASLGFPSSDVISVKPYADNKYELEVSFFGLHGSQSPLPGYYLESLAWEYEQEQPKLGPFLDFFNHRLLTLLHRVWRKYRYYIRFQPNGNDGLSRCMFALVGLGNQNVRNALPINRSKMLAYAGLLANPGRAPEVVTGLVSHCFDLPDVELISWEFRYVSITEEQQNRLGKQNMYLGENIVLGEKVPDLKSKFTLYINELSQLQFRDFLPNGSQYSRLVTFISFVLRDQLAWDLRLGIKTDEINGLSLGEQKSSLLGWSSFLAQPPEQPTVTISVQE